MAPDIDERRRPATLVRAALWWVSFVILVGLVGLFAIAAITRSWRYLGAGLPAARLPHSESFLVVLGLLAALGAVVMLAPPWRRLVDTVPLTRLMLVSSILVLILGLSAFAPCVDRASAPLSTVTATLSLFFGEGSTDLFGDGALRCPGSPPLGYELARFLGVVTALSAVLRVLSQFYRDAADRLGIRWARQIDVVVGSGPGIADLVRGLRLGGSRRRHRIVVLGLTLSDDEVARVRRAGALVVREDSGGVRGIVELPGLRTLRKVERMTVVGEDVAANLALARVYLERRRAMDAAAPPHMHVQVEVGNVFDADLLRQQLLNTGDFELDVFSRHEVAAREIVELAFARFHRIVIGGRSGLGDAILREVHEANARGGMGTIGMVVLAGEVDDGERDRATMALPSSRRLLPRIASPGGSALGGTFSVALSVDLAPSVGAAENLGAKDLVVILPDVHTDVRARDIRAANRAGATVLTHSEQSHGLRVYDHIGPRADSGQLWGLRKAITYGLNLTERQGPPRTFRDRLLGASLWPTGDSDPSAPEGCRPELLDGLLEWVKEREGWHWITATAQEAPFHPPRWDLQPICEDSTLRADVEDVYLLLDRLHFAGIALRPTAKAEAARLCNYRGEVADDGTVIARHPVSEVEPSWYTSQGIRSHDVVLAEVIAAGTLVRTTRGDELAVGRSYLVTHPSGLVELLEPAVFRRGFVNAV